MVWLELEAVAEYLKSGDKRALSNYFKNLSVKEDDKTPLIESALIARDYPLALSCLSELDLSKGYIGFGSSSDLSFSPLELVKALIYYQLDIRDQWKNSAEKARLIYIKDLSDVVAGRNDWRRLAICYALEGNRDQAVAALEKANTLAVNSEYYDQSRSLVYTSIVHLILGEHETAIDLLESIKDLDSAFFLNRELDLWFFFDRLRGNPRFDALLE